MMLKQQQQKTICKHMVRMSKHTGFKISHDDDDDDDGTLQIEFKRIRDDESLNTRIFSVLGSHSISVAFFELYPTRA
jgi:hypothetical protein